MRTRLAPILIAVMLSGCASRADRELEAVKAARSVLAEWVLVEDQADKGRAPAIYAEQMRDRAREQLRTASSQLGGEPAARQVLEQVRTGSPDFAALRSANSALEPLEKHLESS